MFKEHKRCPEHVVRQQYSLHGPTTAHRHQKVSYSSHCSLSINLSLRALIFLKKAFL